MRLLIRLDSDDLVHLPTVDSRKGVDRKVFGRTRFHRKDFHRKMFDRKRFDWKGFEPARRSRTVASCCDLIYDESKHTEKTF